MHIYLTSTILMKLSFHSLEIFDFIFCDKLKVFSIKITHSSTECMRCNAFMSSVMYECESNRFVVGVTVDSVVCVTPGNTGTSVLQALLIANKNN